MVIDGEEQPKTLFRLVKDTIPKDKPSNRYNLDSLTNNCYCNTESEWRYTPIDSC
jgi:hypothetical protein